MAERFEMPQSSDVPEIDISKRYDVYCNERGIQIVVYRNTLIKGIRRLLSDQKFDFTSDFIELEQANGQTVYVSKMAVLKLCKPGENPIGEVVSSE
jgi:hypothetical protein